MQLKSGPLTWLIWLMWACLPLAASAAAPTQTPDLQARVALAILEDPTGALGADQVRSPSLQSSFKPWPAERGPINLGLSDSAFWIRVDLQIPAAAASEWVLELPYFQLRTVDFYAPGASAVRTGAALPLSSRPYLHRFFAFPLPHEAGKATYFLRVTSAQSLTVPVVLWREQEFLRHVQSTLVTRRK